MKNIINKRAVLELAIICGLIFATQSFAAVSTLPEEITVRGKLSRTVEAGGWLILTGKDKYLILNASEFSGESWFREGAQVEAIGETKPDTVTIYQEGMPFEACSLKLIQKGSSSALPAPTT